MTMRRQRSSPVGSRKRSGRNVWINTALTNGVVSPNAITIFDLWPGGTTPQFMTFDTTIQAVRISSLQQTSLTAAVATTRKVACSLLLATRQLDFADIIFGLLATGTGPPWMWHSFSQLAIRVVSDLNLILVSSALTNGVTVRAKRRLRENDMTLWLVVENINGAGDTDTRLNGYFRTLMRIP